MMKGKGKKGKGKDIDEEKSSSPINEFKRIDLSKECPKYLEILDRNVDEECIKLEELDSLQLEIEALLVSVVYRKRQLEDEIECSLNLQDKKDKSNKDSSVKRGKYDDRPTKKFKENPSDNSSVCSENSDDSSESESSFSSSSSSSKTFRAKTKNLKVNKFDDSSFTNYNSTQNDLPNRFWNFVSTYCSPVKDDCLKMLEDLMSLYENEPEILKAVNKKSNINGSAKPNEKIASDQQNGNAKKETTKKKADKQKKGLSTVNSSETTGKQKKSKDKLTDKLVDVDKCDYGVLTQRLVSCLIEEDFCAENFEDIFDELSSDRSGLNTNDTKLLKTMSLNNAAQFEKLLRKELEEHGLIDSDDLFMNNDVSENEDDEINLEIIKCQSELKSVMTQNQFQLKKLINLIKADLHKQELFKKLDLVNEEILEISKRLMIIKQKRKNSKEAKKEKDYVQKYLKERTSLLQQLNQVQNQLI